jgi:hypothetical protein
MTEWLEWIPNQTVTGANPLLAAPGFTAGRLP